MKAKVLASITIAALRAYSQPVAIAGVQPTEGGMLVSWDGDNNFVVQTNSSANATLGWSDAISATNSPAFVPCNLTVNTFFRLRHDYPTILFGGHRFDMAWLETWGLGTNELQHSSNEQPYDWYISQYDNSPCAENNCGPACAAMVLKWLDPNSTNTPASLRTEDLQNCGWWFTYDVDNVFTVRNIKNFTVPYTVANLEACIDRGNMAIVCLDISRLPISGQPERKGQYYCCGTGHFMVVKGYRITDQDTFFEVYDPIGGISYTYNDNGMREGVDRHHDQASLTSAVMNWWAAFIEIQGPNGKTPFNVMEKTKLAPAWGK